MYIVAQMKAAGITAETLLGIPYGTALTLATLVFVLYVSIGGMLAVTWTDVFQGALMVAVVLGTACLLMARNGSPAEITEGTEESLSVFSVASCSNYSCSSTEAYRPSGWGTICVAYGSSRLS